MGKEATLYRKLDGEKVECITCARRCKIPDGSHGFCSVRSNKKGKLYLDNYGMLIAMHLDPIEKKPFYHFMPGTGSFSIGTSSCNFGCLFCQNHEMSKEKQIMGEEVSPEKVVELALRSGAKSIAYTYNEPTIFIEYALDTARLAHEAGLKNVFVTNGYMTLETVKAMEGLVDGAVVNFKGNGDQKFVNKYQAIPSIEPIKESMLAMKKAGIHLEVTDMVVPGVGDSLKACESLMRWIANNMGKDTPIHFIAFHPDYKMLDCPETGMSSLKEHYDVAKTMGFYYIYLGNVSLGGYADTKCPKCKKTLISRTGTSVRVTDIEKESCRNCKQPIFLTL
jgi:pyruvate formate lyase activating enzyme